MPLTAPFHADVAGAPDGGAANWLVTADGLRIRAAHWHPDGARGTVLIFAGRTEYIEKYGPVAAEFTARGFAVTVNDWRGQGLADRIHPERLIGHVGGFADYQHDVRAVLAHAHALDLPQPFFLLAHSMGGCIGLRALHEGLGVRAAAFSAPMWGINLSALRHSYACGLTTVSRAARFSHRLVPGEFTETYVLRQPFEDNRLTGDAAMYDVMRRQLQAHPALALGGPSLHWLLEALREMRTLAALPAPAIPCLTVMGDAEEIVEPAAILRRMEAWPGGRLIVLPGGRHETMMETQPRRKALFDAAEAHFRAHGEPVEGRARQPHPRGAIRDDDPAT